VIAKKGASRYPGELGRPLAHPRNLGLRLKGELSAEERRRVIARKMLLLCDHFGIVRGDWLALACRLAALCVPGLRNARKPGRPTKWSAWDREVLKAAFDGALLASKELGRDTHQIAVLEWLAEQEPFKSKLRPGKKRARAEALKKQLQAARRSWRLEGRIQRQARS
jgi:hypothetical protein